MRSLTTRRFVFPENPALTRLLDTLAESPYRALLSVFPTLQFPAMPTLLARNSKDPSPDLDDYPDLKAAIGGFVTNTDPLDELGNLLTPYPTDVFTAWIVERGIVIAPTAMSSLFSAKNITSKNYATLGQAFHVGTWKGTSGHDALATQHRLAKTAQAFATHILTPSLGGAKDWTMIVPHSS